MENYGRNYSTREEYLQRLEIFAGNMLRAAENQALDPTAIHGVTQFSDLTEDEFQRHYTGVNGGFPLNNGAGGVAPPLEVDGLPEVDPDTLSRCRSPIQIRLPWKMLEKLDPDTPTLYPDTPSLELLHTRSFFTCSIPPSTFAHLHPLRHHHQHRSSSSHAWAQGSFCSESA